ncbi:MAG: ROK family protein [Sulfurovaceae bacterium]|nr:ROK family protein [Sulfurovaceae bacterium]
MNLYIDMGGTYTRYQIDKQDVVVVKDRDIISLIEEIIKKYPRIKQVNISFAGQVKDNIILSAPNINIKNLDLNSYFPHIKFRVDNDLNCAVLGESAYWKSDDIVSLFIGTGIGAGVVSGGRLINGFSNGAGEIGHIPFKQAPFLCGCGKDNCVELFSSGSAILKWADYLDMDFKTLDELPSNIYNDFLEGVLYSTSILITLFNPKILVLGGGVIEENDFLVQYIRDNISKYAFGSNLKELEIVQTKLDNAPLDGCRLLNKII